MHGKGYGTSLHERGWSLFHNWSCRQWDAARRSGDCCCWTLAVREVIKLKEKSYWAILSCGTPEAEDGYQQAKRCAAVAVAEAKTPVGEEFGKAMETDFWTASKRFWIAIWNLRKGSAVKITAVKRDKILPGVSSEPGCCRAVLADTTLKLGTLGVVPLDWQTRVVVPLFNYQKESLLDSRTLDSGGAMWFLS